MLLKLGESEKAIADATRGISINGHESSTYAIRGLGLQRTGKISEGIADYNEAIRLDPGNPKIIN